jgi:hypothetical protein
MSKKIFFQLPWILCTLVLICLANTSTVYSHEAAHTSPAATSFLKLYSEHSDTSVDKSSMSLGEKLRSRINENPFYLVGTIIFFLAIAHTFFAHHIRVIANKIKKKHLAKIQEKTQDPQFKLDEKLSKSISFPGEMMHLLSEIEAIFAIWLVPLFLAITYFFDWNAVQMYVKNRDLTEPMFVVVIMTLSATRPIVELTERCLGFVARLGGGSPMAWWASILTIGPIMGSFITEPAAMTLCAVLLGKQFYQHKPPRAFAYATLGLLFCNISVGGVLTNFAAPPVLMVAKPWGWTTSHMFFNFGWKAIIGILIANSVYLCFFFKQFKKLKVAETETKKLHSIPIWITCVHIALLAWTVFSSHFPPLFVGSFLLFLAFYEATAPHQSFLVLRTPILVGTFLAGLVIHGGLQGWWITPVLESVSEQLLMVFSIVLTAFNDNAAITYLTTLTSNFSDTMKYAVVAGAVTGGGLTVIANAPNPAGQSILSKYFDNGISPANLLLASLVPTIIFAICFTVL